MIEDFLDNHRIGDTGYYPHSTTASLTLSYPEAAPSSEIRALAFGPRSMAQELLGYALYDASKIGVGYLGYHDMGNPMKLFE